MGQPQAECMVRARGFFFFDGNGNLKRGRGRATACGRSVAPFRQGEWDRDSDSDLFFLESTSIDQNSPVDSRTATSDGVHRNWTCDSELKGGGEGDRLRSECCAFPAG